MMVIIVILLLDDYTYHNAYHSLGTNAMCARHYEFVTALSSDPFQSCEGKMLLPHYMHEETETPAGELFLSRLRK